MAAASVYNPRKLACTNPSNAISMQDFTEPTANIIYVSKTSAAGATMMYCIDGDNFEDASTTEGTILELFKGNWIPGFNCDDLRLIRSQLTEPAVLAAIDVEFGRHGKCPPPEANGSLSGPSKGFMLFLRGIICCLKSAQAKASAMEIKVKNGGEAGQQYRFMLMMPLLHSVSAKLDSLSVSEREIHANLPFISPTRLYASGRTLERYVEYQTTKGHCGGSMIGDLCDFYNFNKRKYFRNDDDIVGISASRPCSAAYLSSHCRLSEYENTHFASEVNTSNINANSYGRHSPVGSSNENSNAFIQEMRRNATSGGKRRTKNNRRNRNRTRKHK